MSPVKPLFSIVVAICPRWLLSWIHCVMKRGLVRVVVERRGGGVQVRQRRRVEDRLHACVALRDVDDVAMDVVDRTPDELPEVGSERQRARLGAFAFSTEAISSLS